MDKKNEYLTTTKFVLANNLFKISLSFIRKKKHEK